MMNKVLIPFHKMHVCGNHFVFVAISDLDGTCWSELAVQICAARSGVGADQLVIVQRISATDIRLVIYNPDGSESRFCGNACLAVAAYIERLLAVSVDCTLRFQICEASYVVKKLGSRWWLYINRPRILKPWSGQITTDHRCMYYVDTGTEHLVVICSDAASLNVAEVGKKYELSVDRERPVNVMFVTIRDGGFTLRSWERGGTGETLACASGACASFFALQVHLGMTATEEAMVADCLGGPLMLEATEMGCRVGGQIGEAFQGVYVS